MKKQRTKLRKFLIRTLLFLLLLIGLAGVLSRSKTVQTYLAQKAANWLSKELGVDVRIGSLEFDFFRNIHLERVYLADKFKDTLIAVNALNLEFLSYDGEARLVKFDDAVLHKAVVKIGYHKNDKDKNIDFLLDYINGPPAKSTVPPKLWTIQFANAKMVNCDFNYFDEGQMTSEPGLLDEYNLHFREIHGDLKSLQVIDDSLHFTAVDLRARERSGLELRKMNALCNIHYKGMDFDNLDLYTACSHLKGDLHFKYPGYKHLDEFVSNTNWRGKLKSSYICLGELSVFTADLKGHKETMQVNSMQISGTYDHLKLSAADVSMGSDTRVQGDFYMEGLPDWRTTKCAFDIRYARSNAPDLERLLMGAELPVQLHDAGTLIAQGKFNGKFLNFEWNGTLGSAFGNATTDVAMNLEPGFENAIFSGRIMTESFDLNKFNSSLGVSAFDILLDGKGLDEKHFTSTVDARIGSFTINNRTFADAIVKGDLSAQNFKGSALFNDLRLNAEFDGEIDFREASPVFFFNGSTRGLDLYEVGLDSVHTLVWGKVDVDAHGLTLDELEGRADFQDVYIHRLGKVYEYADQSIIKSGKTRNANLSFSGNLVTGYIRGNYSLANVDAIVINSMAEIFPERIQKRKDYSANDSFEFSISLHQPGIIYSYLDPNISTGPVNLSGNYNYGARTAMFNLQQMDVKYGTYDIKNLEVHANKTRESGLHFEAAAHSFINNGELQLTNIGVSGDALDGLADYNLKLADKSGKYTIDVDAVSNIWKDSVTVSFMQSRIQMDMEDWTIDRGSGLVVLNDGTIKTDYLYLDGKDHYVEAKGTISARRTDTLTVDLGNFGFDFIRPFLKQSALDSMEGRLNGTVHIAGLLGKPRFSGEVSGRDLVFYGVNYGDADLSLQDVDDNGRLSVKTNFLNGILDGLSVVGNISYKQIKDAEQLNLLVDIPSGTSLQLLQPFLRDVVTIENGNLNGQIRINGDIDKPKITGSVILKDAELMVDYLKTSYNFDGEFTADSKGLRTVRPILLHDETGNGVAKGTIAINHTNFENFNLDIRIDSAVNLKCLNTTERDDDIYYGKAWVDGDCHIYGPFDKISMDINLKSRKNSAIKLLYSDVEENEMFGYITFLQKGEKAQDSSTERVSSVLHRINIVLDVTPDLDAEFVIDKQLGDVIKGKGSGRLRMLYDENENFYLFGTYRVQEGDYVFSLPGINLLTKKIALQPGGTIIWTGDPYNSLLNITGSFEKKISPDALMTAVASGGQKSYAPIKVKVNLYMSGNLFSPEIRFDIQAPELENTAGSSANDVYRVIQRIRSDKDETMRQAVALLLFGNFITPSFAQNSLSSSGVISGTGVAGNSLSSIASGVVNDIFTKLGLPTRIQVSIDNLQSTSGSTNTKLFVSSEWFLTDRVRLDLNYDPTSATLVNNIAVPLNFNLEYLTRNENWRFRAFSRSSNLLLQQSSTTLYSSVSGNTLGAGVIYRREFETFYRARNQRDSIRNSDTARKVSN